MFTKKARLLNHGGGFGLPHAAVAVRPCNDNQSVRLVAPRPRKRRPVLFWRWHVTPAGRLEGSWHEGSAAEELGISWPGGAVYRANWMSITPRRGQRGEKTTQRRQSTWSALTDSGRPHSIHGVQVRRFVGPAKRESGATRICGLIRSCPRNCQRRAVFRMCHWALRSKVWEGGQR